jgi:TRAP-type C4-dicarboxylate transport system permease small subunit
MNCPTGEIATDLGCVPQDPVGFVGKFYGIGLGLIGMVAILFLIIGGYYIMTSQGNPGKLVTGKQYVFYSLAGLVLAIMGFVFIQIIASDVLKIPGFN